ncbi:PREDICTED: uncharacterized protein LOC109212401 [Nicotiana attenuata]|uniref:uncharacterized protein LOC109212401 n=1 Tax=Nicotiana attenuata TaxID=49451 RepID=UPI000904E01E|nr:PREDICTED: uncharacterized protein LOC109212401 [Nicotiana attenuata]
MDFAWEYIFFTELNPFKAKKIPIEIRWYKPPKNAIKLNCDGAFSSTNNAAGIGGLFRNSNGDWILGHQKATHAASPVHAELPALLEGLKIAVNFKDTNMEIETDSTDVIKLLHEECTNFQNIILECRWLMHQLKLPLLRHNFREGNEVAHRLAKEALKKPPSDKCIYHACPPFLCKKKFKKTSMNLVIV